MSALSSPWLRLVVLACAPALGLASGGCIGKRRPKRDAEAAQAAGTPAAQAKVAEAKAPEAEAKALKPEPTPEAAPPSPDPNHKYGEASRAPNYAVPAGEGPSKGPEDALVTIVEFNAFDCEGCRKLPPVLDRVLAKWGDDVRLVFRHAPSDTEESKGMARAAVAASAAGKFWEVHDELVASGKLDLPKIAKLVGDKGGDSAKFLATLRSPVSAEQVDQDLKVLDKFRGEAPAPILFVNGRYLDGEITMEQIDALVAEEKAKAEAFMKEHGVTRSAGLYEDMRKRGAKAGAPWRGYQQVEALAREG